MDSQHPHFILNLHISQMAIQKWGVRDRIIQTLEFIWSSILILTYPVHGEFSGLYVEAMKKRIASLIHQNTCIAVPPNEANNVIITTWVFELNDPQMVLQASSSIRSV